MPRRQILSSDEKERLLIVQDDGILLTRMCFLSEQDLVIINKHRKPAITSRHFKMVRYYGFLANRKRGELLPKVYIAWGLR